MNYLVLANVQHFLWGRPVANAVLVGLIIAVIALAFFLYRHPDGLTRPLRGVLLALRLALLALLVVVLLEPTVRLSEEVPTRKRLPVLLDVSESMDLRDQRKRSVDIAAAAHALGFSPAAEEEGDADRIVMDLDNKKRNAINAASRLDLAKSLLTNTGTTTLQSIGRDVDVEHHTFGETLEFIGKSEDETFDILKKLKAKDAGTSITASLAEVAKDRSGAPLAGVVLLSDGIETVQGNLEATVKDLGVRGIPVYSVAVGLPEPDDVSIRSVIMQDVAFAGDTVPVRVQLRSKGYAKRQADLVLRLNDTEVDRETIDLSGGLQYEDVSFDVPLIKKGSARVEIEIEPFADEATADNNLVARSVSVVNEKINVLCIEGSARWEYRYLLAILKRDPRINATFVVTHAKKSLAQLSSDYIERFPEDPEEAFKYDLVIIGDVDSEFFSDAEFSLLEELVRERGGSLLMLSGRNYAPSSYSGTPVEKMLPVTFEADAEWNDVDDGVHPVLTAEGRSSLLMNLENDTDKNDRAWSRMKPMDEIPVFLSARPGATVLAQLSGAESGFPLISWQRYGTGKVMMIGSDRLWLLRYKTGDKYHWRVWSQAIQFLTLSRLMGEHKRIRLESDRSTYPLGEQARIYANVLDESYQPISLASFDVHVGDTAEGAPEAQKVKLRPVANQPGRYEGYYSPPGVGRYKLELRSEESESANSIEFQVTDHKPELSRSEMHRESLQKIADLSGGKFLEIDELSQLSTLVNRAPKISQQVHHKSLWDHWLVIVLIVLFAGTEWIVRRRRDLT
jgi:uncharacterized membrane protein